MTLRSLTVCLSAGEVSTLASTATAPSIINKSIAENSPNGTLVFKARSSDVDAGDGVTYSILSATRIARLRSTQPQAK